MKSLLASKGIKVAVFMLCLVPLARLVWRGLNQGLGPNPIEFITHTTGDWTLIFLVLTLTITPARKLFHLLAVQTQVGHADALVLGEEREGERVALREHLVRFGDIAR